MAVTIGKISSSSDAAESEAPALTAFTLKATEDGCALVDPCGRVVLYADGLGGRRECLRYAREQGALALLS